MCQKRSNERWNTVGKMGCYNNKLKNKKETSCGEMKGKVNKMSLVLETKD